MLSNVNSFDASLIVPIYWVSGDIQSQTTTAFNNYDLLIINNTYSLLTGHYLFRTKHFTYVLQATIKEPMKIKVTYKL